MDDLDDILQAIAAQRRITVKSARRLVLEKQRTTLFPRRLAALALALESNLPVHRVATDVELAQLRDYRRAAGGERDATPKDPAPRQRRPVVVEARQDAGAQRPTPTIKPIQLFDALVSDPTLRDTTRKLFKDGHYPQAIEEGCKVLNNIVKDLSGISTKENADLMHHVFKPDGVVLAINALTKRSERDAQDGYRYMLAGVMSGLRNPRAHEHGVADEPLEALKLLGLLDHLVAIVRQSRKVVPQQT